MHSGIVKTLFIINRVLEKKSRKNIPFLITENLDPGRFTTKILYSEYPGHARILSRENVGKYHLIVAGGGDGTVNQVAQSLVHTETVLGILPLGSGKGLARSLGIPLNIRDAIKIINKLFIVKIDTGQVGQHRFINIAGIGFAAEVAYTYSGTQRRGFFSYAVHMVKNLPGYSPISTEITTENRRISGKFFIISFANSSQWGYGAYISPMSKPDDGLLETCIIKKFPKILFPGLLVRLYTKTIFRSRYVEIIPGIKTVISGNGSFRGHIDGEPVEFTTPFEVSADPGSLKVVCKAGRKSI